MSFVLQGTLVSFHVGAGKILPAVWSDVIESKSWKNILHGHLKRTRRLIKKNDINGHYIIKKFRRLVVGRFLSLKIIN